MIQGFKLCNMKWNTTMPHYTLVISFYALVYCWGLGVPVNGFSLKNCTIGESFNITTDMAVLCHKRNLIGVPEDIPPNARYLDITGNYVSKIKKGDFNNLSVLNILNMSSNLISHVDDGAFVHQKALQQLNLAYNKLSFISDLMFQGLVNVTVLRLGNNHIATIASSSFQFLISLKEVNLTSNRLCSLKEVQPIIHLPNLQQLFISGNNIPSLISSEISNGSLTLSLLDVSHNPLEIFSVTTDVFQHLQTLDISYCGPKSPNKTLMQWNVSDKSFLSSVSHLDMSGVHMSLEGMSMILQTLNSSLTYLKLYNVIYVSEIIDIACHIPTLYTLKLGYNHLNVTGTLLQSCSQVTLLDLSDNQIHNVPEDSFRSMRQLRTLILRYNMFLSVPAATRNLTSLTTLDLSFNLINTLSCSDFAHLGALTKLFLHCNKITGIGGCIFQNLTELKVLKIYHNNILTLDDAFMNGLQNLEYLDLGDNKLSRIEAPFFKSLQSLRFLCLTFNQITGLKSQAFEGLTNLETLVLDGNPIQKLPVSVFKCLTRLQSLSISSNHLKYDSDNKIPPPFAELSSLETLYIRSQRMFYMPSNFLEGLKSLSYIRAGNLNLKSLHPDTFNYTPQLKSLDISKNELIVLSAELFHPIPNLRSLCFSKSRLQSWDFLTQANLNQLNYLQVRQNEFTGINESVLRSLPALTFLDLRNNTFNCDCSNAWFVQWAENNTQTQVVYTYDFTCSYPLNLKGSKLLDLDIHSCSVDIGFLYYISTTCVVLLIQLGSFTVHLLRWQVVYAYYLFLAFLVDTKQKNRRAPNQYDAFVSYNVHDEPWVLGELLPKLEEEQGWKLCLHHRDFQPGKPVIDNITDAIYSSRKTICVISRHYLESEWCSREIQIASFRLFDEQKDVLILVFLEEIPGQQLSPYHRMRKLLKRRTYLSWPRAGHNTSLFWHKLHLALQTREGPSEENPLLTGQERP